MSLINFEKKIPIVKTVPFRDIKKSSIEVRVKKNLMSGCRYIDASNRRRKGLQRRFLVKVFSCSFESVVTKHFIDFSCPISNKLFHRVNPLEKS